MRKAIFVMDGMPDCNQYCPCFYVESGRRCNATNTRIEKAKCPFRYLSEKKEIVPQTSRKKMKQNLRAEGFNSCIDEILKGRIITCQIPD